MARQSTFAPPKIDITENLMSKLYESWLGILAAAPDHIVLHSVEGGVSISQLEARSNRLSTRLQSHSGCNALIAVRFSSDFYVALHACMRSNVTACPVDLTLPQDMLHAQVGRLSISCVIAHKDTPLPSFDPGVQVIVIDDEVGVSFPCDVSVSDMEGAEVSADIPLHRLFTSGSSGEQSLVTIGHRSMA